MNLQSFVLVNVVYTTHEVFTYYIFKDSAIWKSILLAPTLHWIIAIPNMPSAEINENNLLLFHSTNKTLWLDQISEDTYTFG